MKVPKLRENGDGRAFAAYPRSGGRREYFGVYGTPEAEKKYQKWLGEVMASMAAGEPVVTRRDEPKPLCSLAVAYIGWSEVNHGDGEHRNVRETIGLLDNFCGEMLGRDFGPNALRRFQTHLVDSGRFARTTINTHIRRVKRLIRWCQSRELLPPGTVQELETVEPLRKGRTAARETVPKQPVPRAVWEATLPFLRKTTRAMVQIQFWCGMRPGEVCGLEPRYIDQAHSVWLYWPGKHKTQNYGKTLIKAIPEPAQAILAPYLAGAQDRPVFKTQRRRFFSTHSYGQAIRHATERARAHGVQVPDWHPNQLRHSILTDIRERLGIKAAQAWAGHSESATTLIYTWTATSELRQIAEALSRKAG